MVQSTSRPLGRWSDDVALSNRLKFLSRKWSELLQVRAELPLDVEAKIKNADKTQMLQIADQLSQEIETQIVANRLRYVVRKAEELERMMADLPERAAEFLATPESTLSYAQSLDKTRL